MTISVSRKMILASVAATTIVGGVAHAQSDPEFVTRYGEWSVYTADVGEDKICYAVTEPSDKEPKSVDHGAIFFMVSTWASGVAADQPSFMAGYDIREGSEPKVRIGSDSWDMFSSGKEGFIEADSAEERLVGAMRRGAEMRLSAVSRRGTATEYTFSLIGISNALDRAERACR